MLLTFRGAALQLLPELAAFDPATGSLFVADLHLGKAAAFREAGVPLPDGADRHTLAALTALLRRTGATGLTLLGDVFHARVAARESLQTAVDAWLAENPALELTIVPGNHDRRIVWSGWFPQAEVLPEGSLRHGFTLCHHPPPPSPDAGPALCGHLHPGLSLGGIRGRSLKVPCFHLHQNVLTFPAFGQMTGLAIVRPSPGDRCFVPLRDAIVEVPLSRSAAASGSAPPQGR